MCIHLNFDYKKSTQALNYLAKKAGGRINYMKAVKLIFFADRFHTRKYGRPVTKDEYRAVRLGPIPVGSLDIAKKEPLYLSDEILEYAKDFLIREGYDIITTNSLDTDVFSETDIEALDFSYNKFKDKDQYELADYTHNYPEWIKHRHKIESGGAVWMDVEDFLLEPPDGFEKCFELSGEDKDIMRGVLREEAAIDKVL